MFNNKFIKHLKKHKKTVIKFGKYFLIGLLTIALFLTSYHLLFWGKIYPNMYVADISLSGKTVNEAINILSQNITMQNKLVLTSQNQTFDIAPSQIDLKINYSESAIAAFERFRTGNIAYDFGKRLSSLFVKTNMGLRLTLNEELLDKHLSVIAGQIETDPIYPSAKLISGKIAVDKGKKGTEIDIQSLRAKIGYNLAFTKTDPIEIPIKDVDPTLSEEKVLLFQKRAETLVGKSLTFIYDESKFPLNDEALIKVLDPAKEYNPDLLELFIKKAAAEINREPQDSTFVFDNGRVNEFKPAKDGLEVKEDVFKNMLMGNIRSLETSSESAKTLEIPVTKTAPKIQTGDVNNLGIKELIGKGSSRFAHSIVNRIHNVELASSKFKGVLVAPGEIFSFNKTLGDVSDFTGYKQAYIIKDGKTVLGDGGGVCQVSSTLFRAVLNAGLPVIERRAHAYRVSYYEQGSPPGLDATVYDPTTDFKFKNDTEYNILIQPVFNRSAQTLVFELYGTSDGRVSTISKPVVSDLVAPPDDLYIDEPTLPAGQIKQIDYKAWGSKVTFNYIVERDGQVIYKKTFVSNYHPWQAIFQRGTGPAQ
jgi:vancomycin resistance protein YoaR